VDLAKFLSTEPHDQAFVQMVVIEFIVDWLVDAVHVFLVMRFDYLLVDVDHAEFLSKVVHYSGAKA
jgi:hypothetical protein